MTYAAVDTQDAIEHRNMRYAMKFVNETEAEPTDANLTRVLASCTRTPKAEEFPYIRRHVHTYRDGKARAGQDVKVTLLNRAATYSQDAQKLTDMIELGQVPHSGAAEKFRNLATGYIAVADELRKVAAGL